MAVKYILITFVNYFTKTLGMINIRETFLTLTKNTYPYEDEDDVIKLLPNFKFEKDEFGNYYIIVKKSDGTFSDNMFTSHLDTYHNVYRYAGGGKVNHVIKGDFIETDKNSNLGADDKAGMTIMLNMISENVPGLYYFFIGEEAGAVGSTKLASSYTTLVEENKLPKINRCISFDRKGYDFVTTYQSNFRCCSDEFAKDLANRLNEYGFWYKPDNNGGRTDSLQFVNDIQECTNISVGYFEEHTIYERQDIEFLELLSVILVKIDWDKLPINRKIEKRNLEKRKVYTTYYNNTNYNRSTTTSTPVKNTVTISSGSSKPSSALNDINDEEFDIVAERVLEVGRVQRIGQQRLVVF